MSTAPIRRFTATEYLEQERLADHKSEYFAGEIFAMAGASERHVLIVGNVARELGNRLRNGPCRVYSSDLRVKVTASGLYTYPDVVVACEERQFEDDHRDTLLNPTILIEVLSPSTENYDRTTKFGHYATIPTLREYVLVAQDRVSIEQFERGADGVWNLTRIVDPTASLRLTTINCEVAVAEIYENALS